MDSKIILNLLGRRRRVTAPLLNRFLQNPHLRSAHYSAELVSTESHSPELPYSRLTPCLDLNEPESTQKSQGSRSRAELLLSLPHVLAQRSPVWINNPTGQELHHIEPAVSFGALKRMASIPIHHLRTGAASPHASCSGSSALGRWGQPCRPFAQAQSTSASSCSHFSSFPKPSRQARELLQQSTRLYGVDVQ